MTEENWIKIFLSTEELLSTLIPNKVGKMEVNGIWISLLYTNEKLFAFEANCPHQNFPFVGAKASLEYEVICPLHKYKFNLINGQGHGLSLSCYPIKENEGSYYIQLPNS